MKGNLIDPNPLFSDGTHAYFSVSPTNGYYAAREPWVTDGTSGGTLSQPATVQVSVTAANSGGSGSSGLGSSGSGDAGGKSGGGGPLGALEIGLLMAVALVRSATSRRITGDD